MQDSPLNLVHILEHAARFHSQCQVVTRCVEDGSVHRYTYADAMRRTSQLAHALRKLGVQFGDRVATMGWNTFRHFEAWFAIAGQGAICHTLNPRLFDDQIRYIVNHAEDTVLLVDTTFVPILERLQDSLPTIERFIVMTDEQHLAATKLRGACAYESLIADEPEQFDWPTFPEVTPSSLCYTSGTTGDPKGVLYTHRSNFLHAYAINGQDAVGLSAEAVALMVVPMFHANSWGLTYAAPMVGAKLVLPGAQMDGAAIYQLLDSERVTVSGAVPTVWNFLLQHLAEHDLKLPYLKEVTIGGSAVPRSMIEIFDKQYDVAVLHGWGMTETSPVGSVCRPKPFMQSLSYEERLDIRVKQGRPLFGISMKILDDDGNDLPHDGKACGRLMVKGPWVVKRYYKETQDAVDADGWFDTGDIASIDEHGYMQITDRAKDLIKSGGEWISSVDLENAVLGHNDVAMAAVIGVPHPKWEERPLLVIKAVAGADLSKQDLLDFLRGKVVKWWLPDDVVFVDDIPLTATGKVSKRTLRDRFRNHPLPAPSEGDAAK